MSAATVAEEFPIGPGTARQRGGALPQITGDTGEPIDREGGPTPALHK